MSERKNIKRNNKRVGKEQFLRTGRKGHSQMRLDFPGEPYLQLLVRLGLL